MFPDNTLFMQLAFVIFIGTTLTTALNKCPEKSLRFGPCPEKSQRRFRHTALSCNISFPYYICLHDTESDKVLEECANTTDYTNLGQKYVWTCGFRNIDCPTNRYQPYNLYRSDGHECQFLKSTCNEIGQITHSDGSPYSDTSCSCDETKGYKFVVKPRGGNYCVPSVEDCSCYCSGFSCTPVSDTTIPSVKLPNTSSEEKASFKANERTNTFGIKVSIIGIVVIVVCLFTATATLVNGLTYKDLTTASLVPNDDEQTDSGADKLKEKTTGPSTPVLRKGQECLTVLPLQSSLNEVITTINDNDTTKENQTDATTPVSRTGQKCSTATPLQSSLNEVITPINDNDTTKENQTDATTPVSRTENGSTPSSVVDETVIEEMTITNKQASMEEKQGTHELPAYTPGNAKNGIDVRTESITAAAELGEIAAHTSTDTKSDIIIETGAQVVLKPWEAEEALKRCRLILEKEIRVALVGKTGVGKSSVANTICGSEVFQSGIKATAVTKICQEAKTEIQGKSVLLIDTPGIFDTEENADVVKKEIKRCIHLGAPGLNAILFVVEIGRFRKEDIKAINTFLDFFQKDLLRYVIMVFTHGDLLAKDRVTLEEYLKGVPEFVKEFLTKCDNRMILFNNELTVEESFDQVQSLLSMIESLKQANEMKYYSDAVFRDAERHIQEYERTMKKNFEDQLAKALGNFQNTLKKEREDEILRLKEEYEERLTKIRDEIRKEIAMEKSRCTIS